VKLPQRPVSVGVSSEFLHLISYHISAFDDVAKFLKKRKKK